MRILGTWLGVALAVGLGYALGFSAGPGPGPLFAAVYRAVVGLAAGGIACAVVGAVRGRPHWLAAALLAFALARGLDVGVHALQTGQVGPRGVMTGVRSFAVVGASVSGPRCEIVVRDLEGGGPAVSIWSPPGACPRAEGQTVQVAVRDLKVAAWRPASRAAPQAPAWTVGHVFAGPGEAAPYWGAVARVRDLGFAAARGRPDRGFVVASTVGVRSALPKPVRTALRRAGLGHLIAVSGLHVVAAAWGVRLLASRVSVLVCGRHGPGVVLGWLAVAGYVGLTGGSAPAVRAAMMFGLLGIGELLGRPIHGLTTLAVAASAMLVWRPAWALDPGFQLSAAAMAVLVRAPAGAGVLTQTWRVTWAVMPLSLWHFGDGGGYAVLANIVAVPVFTVWVVPWALVGWVLMPVWGALGLDIAAVGAEVILDVAAVMSRWPPIPAPLTACIAAAALGLRGLPAVRRSKLWARGLPPLLASLGLLGVVLIRGAQPSIGPMGPGYAVARGTRVGRIGWIATPAGISACLDEAAASPTTVHELLPMLGIEVVGRIESPRPGAPHLAALRAELDRVDRLGEPVPACILPTVAAARVAIASCRATWGPGPVVATVGAAGTACLRAGRWLK